MKKAVFSYEGEEVWKFQDTFFVRNSDNCVIYTDNDKKIFDNIYEALEFITEVTGRYAVFKIGED
jgi:hypothetical protein